MESPATTPLSYRRPGSVSPDIGSAIRSDRVFVAGVIVWILALIPSFYPVFGEARTFSYVDQYSDVPGLLMVVLLIGFAWRKATEPRERGFWVILALSVCAMLGVRTLYVSLPAEAWLGRWGDLAQDAFYVASYLILWFALARRPDGAVVRGLRGRLMLAEYVAAAVFVFAVISYFILIPSVFAPDHYRSWVPSMLMYVVLDAFLAARFYGALRGTVAPEWRWTYGWLAAAFGAWLVADGLEALLYLGILPWIDPGTPADVIWAIPTLCLMTAVASRHWPKQSGWEDEAKARGERLNAFLPVRTAIGALAVALPTLHFALGALGIRTTTLDGSREVLLLVSVSALAGLLMWHQQLMRKLARSLDADRQLISDQLHISQRMEAVGRLASGVAHDFSNILSVIRGRAELLMMTGQVRDEGVDDTREIVEASRRGQSLVTHLLTLGRRRPSEAEVIDLAAAIEELQPLLERLLPDSIEIRVSKADSGLPIIQADRAHVEQVVLNLVVNARDAMPEGGTLQIRTEVVDVDDHFAAVHGGTKGGEYTMLRVTDAGSGVPPELRHLVFEPFFTTKEQDVGTGLGLSIVYGVARQVQGFVRIADAPGGGAVFEVYLPKAQREPTAKTRRERRGPSQGRETILLVEDYEALRKTAARILQESGYRVLEAGSAAEALSILQRRNERIELLVADLVLPDLSGFELEVRALEQLPQLATVFISGYPEGVTPLRIPEGATILEKPFSPEVLTFTVRRVLDERKRFLG